MEKENLPEKKSDKTQKKTKKISCSSAGEKDILYVDILDVKRTTAVSSTTHDDDSATLRPFTPRGKRGFYYLLFSSREESGIFSINSSKRVIAQLLLNKQKGISHQILISS